MNTHRPPIAPVTHMRVAYAATQGRMSSQMVTSSKQAGRFAQRWRTPAFAPLLALVCAIAFLVACGGGGDYADDRDAFDRALASMTDEQLAVMLLTSEELSQVLDLPFEFACSAVEIDNQRVAEASIPQDDTAADQERAGRINGYFRAYPFLDTENDQSVSVYVDLYGDAASASAAHVKMVDDLKTLEGQPLVETFTVEGLGGDATLIRGRLSEFQGPPFTTAVLDFEQLLIIVGRNAEPGTDEMQMAEIGRAQVERIRRELRKRCWGLEVLHLMASASELRKTCRSVA